MTACSGSTRLSSANRPYLTGADTALTKVCPSTVVLPQRPLTQLEIETLWGQDRYNLVNCGARHKALVEFFKNRDDGLR